MLNNGLANSKQDNVLFLFSSIFTLTKTDNNIILYSLSILQIPKALHHALLLLFDVLSNSISDQETRTQSLVQVR